MAKNETIRVRPAVLQADIDAYTALQTLADYQPAKASASKTAVGAVLAAMKGAQEALVKAQNALDAARDAAAAAEWDFHNLLLNVKDQVMAQYGKDSDAVQSLGLKKKSEHKSPARKKKI